MEQRFEVITYGVDYKCEACPTGVMMAHEKDKFFMQGEAMLIRHSCTVCGARIDLATKYPSIQHERNPWKARG
jgi:hypothetical protein